MIPQEPAETVDSVDPSTSQAGQVPEAAANGPEDAAQAQVDAAADETPEAPAFAIWRHVIVGLFVVAAIAVRFYHIKSPIVEAHAFRQTQTAMTVWVFMNEGISLLHAQLPLFGPPWRDPLEFPIFQASAALLAKALNITSVDLACRFTGMLYFTISGVLLYFIVRHFFKRRWTAEAVVLFYLWSPFTILWSRASMIEFAAVAYALAYLYLFLLWLRSPRWIWLVPLAIVAGSLGALTKITSMASIIAPMLAMASLHLLDQLKRDGGFAALGRFLSHAWLRMATMAAIFLIPVLVGQWWVAYADHVKAATPATDWQTSTAMGGWIYGSLGQRLTFMNWQAIFFRVGTFILPYCASFLPVIAFVGARHENREARVFIYSAFVAVIMPPAIFFNLYMLHDYYLCAVTPFLALLAGFGAEYAWTAWMSRDKILGGIAGVAAMVASFLLAWPYLIPAVSVTYENSPYCKVGEAIARVTAEGEYVAMFDFDWDPGYLYYAKRKGYMFKQERGTIVQVPLPDDKLYVEPLRDPKFTTLICGKQHDYIFSLWRDKKEVASGPGIHIIKVHDYIGPGAVVVQTPPPAQAPQPPSQPPQPKPVPREPFSFDP